MDQKYWHHLGACWSLSFHLTELAQNEEIIAHKNLWIYPRSPSYLVLCCAVLRHSVVSDSAHGVSPGKNTGVSCHALLQGIFQPRDLNPGLLHCRQILYHLGHQGSCKRHEYKSVLPLCVHWDSFNSLALSENRNNMNYNTKHFLKIK